MGRQLQPPGIRHCGSRADQACAVNQFCPMCTDSLVARSLTRRYVVALTLIALLSTAAWLSLHLVIEEQNGSAALVNISGRQRMLSQQTALFASLLVNGPQENRSAIRQALEEATERMRRSHAGLIHGDPELGLPARMSDTVHAMYFEPPMGLDQQVQAYLTALRELLRTPDAELHPDNPQLQYIISVSPFYLVSALDEMAAQYQREGEAAVTHLQSAETIVWLITLLLLVVEGAFIFRPFAHHVGSVIARLHGATRRLRQYQKELESFNYSVSHDLRAPLRAINAMSAVMREDFADTMSEEARRHLTGIADQASRMDTLLNGLMDLSRVTSCALQPQLVDLSELARDVVAALQTSDRERSVRVNVAHGLQAYGDRRLLQSAIQNLIGNAWKYTLGKPDPTIVFNKKVEGDKTVFFIRDNGVGFDTVEKEMLFRSFLRLSTADGFEGSGIGLATVQRIFQRHGGRIWADAIPGEGATFYFTLQTASEWRETEDALGGA